MHPFLAARITRHFSLLFLALNLNMEPVAIIEIKFLDQESVRFPLRDRYYFIGRSDRCQIRFSDDAHQSRTEALRCPLDRYQSAVHCTLILVFKDGLPYYRIKDGEISQNAFGSDKKVESRVSTNGVFVNGERLTAKTAHRHSLKHGDYVKLSPMAGFTYLVNALKEERDTRDTFTEGQANHPL